MTTVRGDEESKELAYEELRPAASANPYHSPQITALTVGGVGYVDLEAPSCRLTPDEALRVAEMLTRGAAVVRENLR